jgi:putative transposase
MRQLLWWNRLGPIFFPAEIRKMRVAKMRRFTQWRWYLHEVFVKVNRKLLLSLAGCR